MAEASDVEGMSYALIWVFAVVLGWVPAGGTSTPLAPYSTWDVLRHMFLPMLAITLSTVALYARYMRMSMLDQLSQAYIRTAVAKGAGPSRISWRHIIPNAVTPVLTILATNMSQILSTAFLFEIVFDWQGIGKLFVYSAYTEDYNVLMAILVFLGLAIMFFNLAMDVAYALVDRRIVYA